MAKKPNDTPVLFDEFTDPVDTGWRPVAPPSLNGVKEIFFDTEFRTLRWWDKPDLAGISIWTPELGGFYLPIRHAGGGNLDEAVVKRWVNEQWKHIRCVGLNTRGDVHQLREWGADLEAQGCTVGDVSHYAALLDDHRMRFNLDALAQEYLGREKVGKELNAKRMADYHSSVVAPRAIMDAQLCGELQAAMWPKLDAEGLQVVRQLEDDVIFVVCEMEKNGSLIDEALLDRWLIESERDYFQCLFEIRKMTGLDINPDSPSDQMKLFQHCGVSLVFLDSGRASFTDEIVKRVRHPAIVLMRRAGKLADLRSKFLVKYKHSLHNGILRYALHQLRMEKEEGAGGAGTVTGRFSSGEIIKGEGVNIQAQMKVSKQIATYGDLGCIADKATPWACATHGVEGCAGSKYLIRKLHIPEPGMEKVSADGMQIEYRFFASYTKSKHLIAAYKADPLLSFHKLIHSMIQPHIEGYTYDQTKTLNFLKIYGGGFLKMAHSLGLITDAMLSKIRREEQEIRDQPEWEYKQVLALYESYRELDKAREIDRIYEQELPEVKPLLKTATDLAKKRGYVRTILGRRSRFGGRYNREYKALNSVLQGGATGDYMKLKLVELHRERKQTGLKLRYTIHDAIDGDGVDGTYRKVHELLDRQSLPQLRVPILWEVKRGPNWAEMRTT